MTCIGIMIGAAAAAAGGGIGLASAVCTGLYVPPAIDTGGAFTIGAIALVSVELAVIGVKAEPVIGVIEELEVDVGGIGD